MVKTMRIIKRLLKTLRYFLNNFILCNIEKIFYPKYSDPIINVPIFIIGAPRSGSTLLIQVLINAFKLSYISNMHTHFYGAPALIEYLSSNLSTNTTFTSDYGRTDSSNAPAEASTFWYRFFPRNPAYIKLEELDKFKMKTMRQSVASFCNASPHPVIFKNLYNTLRLEALTAHIPEALFIVIKRDELSNAKSLLKGRLDFYNDYNKWFSFHPPTDKDLLNLPPEAQVIEQIRLTYSLIDKDLTNNPNTKSKVIEINYENFCHDVHGNLSLIESFLKSNGISIMNNKNGIPETFEISKKATIEKSLLKKLSDYIQQNPN